MLKKKKNYTIDVAVLGSYGYGNLGDEAILSAIVSSLKGIAPEISLTVFSNNPEETTKLHNVQSVFFGKSLFGKRFTNMYSVIRELRKTDILIIGGGGIVHDMYIFPLIAYLFPALVAKMMGCKVVFYAVGVGPINSKIGKLITRSICGLADLFTVRDKESQETLTKLGLRQQSIHVTADPALSLEAINEKLLDNIINVEDIADDVPLIGVNIRSFYEELIIFNRRLGLYQVISAKDEENYQKVMASCCDYFTERGYNIVFIPMQDIDTKVFVNKIINKLKNKNQIHILSGNYDAPEIIGIIKKLDLFIGTRLHSLILSTLANTPMIALSYSPKVKNFMELINHEDNVIEIPVLTFDNLINLANKNIENKNSIKEKIATELKVAREVSNQNALLTKTIISQRKHESL
jgi:L-malate glycosyltransferase